MRSQTFALNVVYFIVAWAITFAAPALAKDVFLTIGGGYDPSGNQVSLENNVIFLQRTLRDQYPDDLQHDIYFADGAEPTPDLQFLDPKKKSECPPAQRLMSVVLGSADSVATCYRNHRVRNVAGPTELAALKRRFRELGRELKAGDRLFIYVTGHGGPAASSEDSDDYDYEYDYEDEKWVAKAGDGESATNEDQQYNTSFFLWDSEEVTATDFARWLDEVPPDVTVVLVMVQCFSGGFANSIFHRHDPELGLAAHRRCGFFSQVHDRGAAGCTPEVNEADYQEYSTFFWAALGGKTRLGEAIERPDYNGDGKTSLSEAHAYTVIESDTIDIPVRTSEALLRRYSRLGREGNIEKKEDGGGGSVSKIFGLFGAEKVTEEASERKPLLDAAGPLADLLPKARPEERAILEELAQKLELPEPVTVEAIRMKLTQSQSDGSAVSMKYQAATETLSDCESELNEDVCKIWPELNESFSPLMAELVSDQASEFVETVKKLPSYAAWSIAKKREEELTEELLEVQRVEARVQRLLRTIENVVYAENLRASAPADIVDRYHQLIALEEGTLDETTDQATPEVAENTTSD